MSSLYALCVPAFSLVALRIDQDTPIDALKTKAVCKNKGPPPTLAEPNECVRRLERKSKQ